ncbi:MAG: crosslink repair DNA glycosylase YcaQ family protein [Pseudomonadota bacterium]
MASRRATRPPITPVSTERLRRMALHAQGLLEQTPFGRGRGAVQRAVERLGYVQIDTISVVARAHDHVLHSRVPNYEPKHLDRLQDAGVLFEYWYHAAAYLPMRDYRFALPHMERMRNFEERWIRSRDTKLMAEVLARVADEGPLMARDFESPPAGASGWWNWKPTKRALEQLFMQGDLMVTGRDGFQKSYDLRERVLPADTDTRMPTQRELADHLLETTIGAHGFIAPKAVTHLRRGQAIRQALTAAIDDRLAAGTLLALQQPCGVLAYTEPERLEGRAPRAPGRALLLSPFDPAVIHRDRVLSVFDFDYQIECYLKEADRRFGYFCLPIAYRDQLVGRVDCKAHRDEGRFELKHLHLEPPRGSNKLLDAGFLPALADAIKRFAAFNGCAEVTVTKVSPGSWQEPVAESLAG